MTTTPWDELPDEVQRSIAGAFQAGVPRLAVAFYARWWQLETALRELAYLELRAAHGQKWLAFIESQAREREERDAIIRYMATPDAAHTLAYLGSGYLFDLIESSRNWRLFEPSLPPRKTWQGMADQLKQLRNRNAHCRRPHPDDLARLEQTLRDLEPGLWRAFVSYNNDFEPSEELDDPLVAAWLRREHSDAARLVEHARAQYQVAFRLSYSRRPWAEPRVDVISGSEGYLWHANFNLLDGELSPSELWGSHYMQRDVVRDLIVHLVMTGPSSVTATFSAVDDPTAVAGAIGSCFDAVLMASRGLRSGRTTYESWQAEATGLDARVHLGDALAMAHETTPFSIFNADRQPNSGARGSGELHGHAPTR